MDCPPGDEAMEIDVVAVILGAVGEQVRALLERLRSKAYRGVLVGTVATALLQSSSIAMVLLIGLINVGVVSLRQGIGVMLGAEIGTTVTAQIASLGMSHPARQLARAQLLVNVIGAAVFIPLVPWYAGLMASTSSLLARQIANAHTLFNVGSTLAFLPLVGALAWLAGQITRGREPVVEARPQHLAEAFLAAPAVALSQARHEVLRMSDLTCLMRRPPSTVPRSPRSGPRSAPGPNKPSTSKRRWITSRSGLRSTTCAASMKGSASRGRRRCSWRSCTTWSGSATTPSTSPATSSTPSELAQRCGVAACRRRPHNPGAPLARAVSGPSPPERRRS